MLKPWLNDNNKATYNHGENCEESIRTSLRELRTEYLDLVLIHWPGVKGLKLDDERNSELRKLTYEHLEKLYWDGTVKLIGVSNYTLKHLKELLAYAKVTPHLLQVKSNYYANTLIYVII